MDTSNWVAIIIAIFLGVFAPTLAEWMKRWYYSASLKIVFEEAPPYCHMTYWVAPLVGAPVYFFRFKVFNDGRIHIRRCEAVFEALWVCDEKGKPQKYKAFSDVNLRWSGAPDGPFKDINPHRGIYCDIGHVSVEGYQIGNESGKFVDVPGASVSGLRFLFDEIDSPYGQPNCLLPGKYIAKISVYAENVSSKDLYFQIDWSGKWQDTESGMFKELSLRRVSRPKD